MKKLIIDTDLGADCDDAGAIALACLMHRRGEIDVLGIGHNTDNRYGIEATDILCRQFGCAFPLASCKNALIHARDGYAEKLVKKFGARTRYEDTPDAVALYRRLLSEEREVCLVGIGQANNLSALIDSPADGLSPCGRELLERSVKEVVLMAGSFSGEDKKIPMYGVTGEAEYNVATDIPSMRNFIAKCPVPVTFADYRLGAEILTLGCGDGEDPLSFAYLEFCGGARESWDLVAILYAVYGKEIFIRHGGTVLVDEYGVTHYAADGGKDGYVRSRYGCEDLKNRINRYFGIGETVCVNG